MRKVEQHLSQPLSVWTHSFAITAGSVTRLIAAEAIEPAVGRMNKRIIIKLLLHCVTYILAYFNGHYHTAPKSLHYFNLKLVITNLGLSKEKMLLVIL